MNGFAGQDQQTRTRPLGEYRGTVSVREGNVLMAVDNVCVRVCEVEWFPMLLTAVINLANLANSTLH